MLERNALEPSRQHEEGQHHTAGQREAVDDGCLWRDGAKLELDRDPCRAPNEHSQHVEKRGHAPTKAFRMPSEATEMTIVGSIDSRQAHTTAIPMAMSSSGRDDTK